MDESKQRIQRMYDRMIQMDGPASVATLCTLYEEAMGERDQLYTDLDDANDYIRELQERLEKYEPEVTPDDRESLDNAYGY